MGADILIKDGLLVDGTGAPAYRGNVAVKDGKIASVGNGAETADRVIDADGLAVAPGFWDMHTHYDAQLLWDPIATSTCWHGVTTVIMGNCGFTIAPCKPEDQDWMARMLARVEGMDIGVLRRTLPWPWESFGEYLDTLDKGLGVNAIAQVGHSAVRRYVMGPDASEREATEDEIEQMKAVLATALAEGGVGLTTSRGFSHWDGDGRPVPSRAGTLDEFMELAGVLRGTKVGYMEMAGGHEYTYSRSEGRARMKRLTEVSGRPVCWNAISATLDAPDVWERRLADFNAMRAEGVPFFALGYTQPDDFEFNFRFTNVFDRFPSWQKVLMLDREKKLRAMRDPATRDVLREEMKSDPLPALPARWDRIVLVKAATPKYERFNMMKVSDIAAELGKDPLDTAFDIALEEDLGTQMRLLDSRNPDENVIPAVLNTPHIAAGFTDAGAHLITEVNTGFCTRMLGYWVREKQAMTLEHAVRVITGVPAEESGITDRGFIKEGLAADITIFDPETVDTSNREFVDDMPGGATRLVQHATGIEYTLVNGRVLIEDGKHSGDLPGRTLRSTYYN